MITTETPYKLADIIRDTWPQLYRPPTEPYTKKSDEIMNPIAKIERNEYTDYYSVFDKNGKKVCDTLSLEDALMMVGFDSSRTYVKNRFLPVVSVNVHSTRLKDPEQLPAQNILPERTAEPFVV